MKHLTTLFAILLSTNAFGQTAEEVSLEWKLAEGEVLQYETLMDVVELDSIELDLGWLADAIARSDSSMVGKLGARDSVSQKPIGDGLDVGKFFRSISSAAASATKVVSELTKGQQGHIDIVMKNLPQPANEEAGADSTESAMQAMFAKFAAMNGNVVLRGSVYASGGIHSFWLTNAQKNLVALFFQLPDHPVKIGDTWSIDVDMIALNGNFTCQESSKKNTVRLVDIKDSGDERIAVLRYDIQEYVAGEIAAFGNTKPTSMQYSFVGEAEFSLTNGRWNSFRALLSQESTGVMGQKSVSNYSLIRQ